MIRSAEKQDIFEIAETYTELLQYEVENGSNSNWKLNVYPTIDVPKSKIPIGTMYVLEEVGEICASMVLNQEQPQEYADIPWESPAANEQVLVIHTLCIPPQKSGKGYGRKMVGFAKEYALQHSCTVIRIDTYAYNEPAKKLYRKNGFRIAGYGRILLQGLIDEEQVYLECEVLS